MMASTTTTEVKGLRELSAKLKSMPIKLGRKTLRKAVTEGGKVLLYTAINKVDTNSRRSGTLSKAIKMSVSSRRARGTILNATAKIGVRRNATLTLSRKKGTTYEYWKAIEFGTETEFGTSKTPAEPFLRPTLPEKKDQAVKFVARALKKGIIESAR